MLEVVVEALGAQPPGRLQALHARREVPLPRSRDDRGMRGDPGSPPEREVREVSVSLEPRRVIRVEMRQHHRLGPLEPQVETRGLARLAQHLADRVWAVDEQQRALGLDRERRRYQCSENASPIPSGTKRMVTSSPTTRALAVALRSPRDTTA